MNNIGTVDLFAFKLGYNEGTSPLYNGNISSAQWKTRNTDSSLKTYNYAYDALNRITNATDNTGRYNLTGVSYDKNGNILTLQRQGHIDANATLFGSMDNLVYDYAGGGNKLTKVSDNGNVTYGFKDGTNVGDDFTYDQNGNMNTDANKGITNITYNHLNLPTNISMTPDPGYDFSGISYVYDATGAKLSKTVTTLTQVFGGTSGYRTTTQYTSSGFVYTIGENKDPWSGDFQISSDKLEFIPTAEGYVEPVSAGSTTFVYVYQYKDHLGNIRLSYADSNGDGVISPSFGGGQGEAEIREENNYYPFGLKHKGYNNAQTGKDHKYGYNGKEEQDELSLAWLDLGARNYDASLGRFMNVDPLAESYNIQSVYAFALNNPISFVDVNGEGPLDDFHIFADGSIVRLKTEDKTDTFIFHDSDGNQHNIATLEKNENGLINAPNIQYDSSEGTSVDVSSKEGNESEINISGKALASLIGASADSGESILITRASNADGSSPGDSKSHIDGNNVDIRFAGKDGSRNPLNFEKRPDDFNKIDLSASSKLNSSLNKFGFKFIGASMSVTTHKVEQVGSTTVLSQSSQSIPGTNYLHNHSDHLHLQGFRPNLTERNKAVPIPTLSSGLKL